MSLDLTLLPITSTLHDRHFAGNLIQLQQDDELYGEIRELPTTALDLPLSCHKARGENDESTFGPVTRDHYGNALTFATVGDLLTLKSNEAVNRNWLNKSMWAMFSEMPKSHKIALYWH